MKVYSPSQTKLWMTCPQQWWLERKQGWTGKQVVKRNYAAALGSAYGLGMAHYLKTGRKLTIEEVTEIATNAYNKECNDLWALREMCDEEKYLEYLAMIPKMVTKTLKSDDFIPESWTVTAVEGLVRSGYIDLGGLDERQKPWFWDFKVKTFVKTSSVDYTFMQYENDWQMLHYAWAYSEYLGQFVDVYYIGLMVVSPTCRFYVKPFYLKPETVAKWLTSAVTVWAQMEEAEQRLEAGEDPLVVAPMSNEHWGRFGKCSSYGLCFEDAVENYIQIERTRPS